ALARGRQEHLGRGGVAVFLQEVVLDLPHVVEADPVGQLDLVEGVREQLVLALGPPGAGQLVLVEDAEPHRVPSRASGSSNARNSAGPSCSSRSSSARRRLRNSRAGASRPGQGWGSISGGSKGSASKQLEYARAMAIEPGRGARWGRGW